MNNKEVRLFITLNALCVAIILGYQAFRCYNNDHYKDPLLVQYGFWDIDGWSLTHIVFFGILGCLFPDHFVVIMSTGVLWEIMEDNVMHWLTKDVHFLNCRKLTTDNAHSKTNHVWWFGRVSDVLMDLIGFGVGYVIRRTAFM